MRYHLAVLMLLLLLVVLPVMNLPAAPAPEPLGILDIGTPPKWKTAEQHLEDQIKFKTDLDSLNTVCSYPEVKKFPSVASMKDARPWLAKNLRITPEKGGRRLRFTFRTGKRNEQATIINAFLRASLHWNNLDGKKIKRREEELRFFEDLIPELERRIKASKDPQEAASLQEGINNLRDTRIPAYRAEIARLKQYAVIKWAR